ncbi:MAG: imelysin family protein [Bacteroidota bacterium]
MKTTTYNFIKKAVLSSLLVLAVVIGCDSSDDTDGTPTDDDMQIVDDDMQTIDDEPQGLTVEEGRQMQIDDLYDYQIVPLLATHNVLTTDLAEAANNFDANTNTENLNALRVIWQTAFLHWKQLEIYNIGVIQSSFAHSRIHQWPINVEFIEDNIAEETDIDTEFITTVGASSKGYGALELLLFEKDESQTIDSFTVGENFENRMDYLTALAHNLNLEVNALTDLWDTFEETFKSRLETGVNGSQNQIVNGMIAALETIKLRKLGSEDANNTEEDLEAFYSRSSKEAIRSNLVSLKNTYEGNFDTARFGLESYVDEVLDRPDINTAISNAFVDAITTLDGLSGSLEDIVVNDDASVETFRATITTLIALFKTDLSSAANIVVTFNDNDGDSQ